jgi:hypothetical protein
MQAGLQAKPKLGTRDSMELGIAGVGVMGRVPRTAAEVADPRWVIDKVTDCTRVVEHSLTPTS